MKAPPVLVAGMIPGATGKMIGATWLLERVGKFSFGIIGKKLAKQDLRRTCMRRRRRRRVHDWHAEQ